MARERSMMGTSSGRAAVMGHARPITARMKPIDPLEGADPHLVVLTGDLDVTSERQLLIRLRDQIMEFGPELVLDLSQVEFVDSTGLGVLVSAFKSAREQGGHITLLDPSREIGRLLQITGLDRVFQVRYRPS
jgi:anti-sigma B factor antagonist